jgi:hypothetical protein
MLVLQQQQQRELDGTSYDKAATASTSGDQMAFFVVLWRANIGGKGVPCLFRQSSSHRPLILPAILHAARSVLMPSHPSFRPLTFLKTECEYGLAARPLPDSVLAVVLSRCGVCPSHPPVKRSAGNKEARERAIATRAVYPAERGG